MSNFKEDDNLKSEKQGSENQVGAGRKNYRYIKLNPEPLKCRYFRDPEQPQNDVEQEIPNKSKYTR